jgi:UPF0716 protein FxsA
MANLLLLFIVLPAVELYLLIRIGELIGAFATVGLIIVTGAIGAAMARSQGLRVLSAVQREIAAGELPAGSLVDGLMILIAAALLVTPGVLTDAFGFLCLTPGFRVIVKRELERRFAKAVEENRVSVHIQGLDSRGGSPGVGFDTRDLGGTHPVIDVTPVEATPPEETARSAGSRKQVSDPEGRCHANKDSQ